MSQWPGTRESLRKGKEVEESGTEVRFEDASNWHKAINWESSARVVEIGDTV